MLRFLPTTLILACCFVAATPRAWAEEPASPDKKELYKQLEETLTNAKFSGRFTVLGKEQGDLPKEEYTILSATKVETGEMWLLKARIKYGDKNTVIPIPLEILWAGKTPVITLDKLTLPGLGTFSARVVIHDGKYAGTWQHDAVGGHLFGTIEKVEEKQEDDSK
jgi:hypothetical protein